MAKMQSAWRADWSRPAFGGYEANAWMGYGAPVEIRRWLATEIDAIVKAPAIRERLVSWGSEPLRGMPEEMDRMLAEDRERWGRVVQMAGIEKE